MKSITLSTLVLGLALALGACASEETAPPTPSQPTQDANAKAMAEQAAADEAKANAAREIAMAQQAERDAAEQQAKEQKAAAEAAAAKAAADKAAADKAAAEKQAAEAAAAKAAADKAAAESAAREKSAANKTAAEAATAKEQKPVVNPPLADMNVVAELETSAGTMVIGFYPDVAPGHVKNFVELARKGFYDGTRFHRTIPGFMIQGGDPNTKDPAKSAMWGSGGPGYKINAEFNSRPHVRGTLSMARSSDPNSAGSQFFICNASSQSCTNLNGQYTVFGELLKGYDVLDKISTAPTVQDGRENSRPLNPVQITKVTVRARTPADVKQDDSKQ